MVAHVSLPATYAELEALPDDVLGQIVDGELVALPRPTSLHANAATHLAGELHGPFARGRGGPGGWVLLFEPELHLGNDVLVPDLAGWRRERMPEVPDVKTFTLIPDWVCEILSPSSASLDRVKKTRIYAAAGVPWYWIVDPLARTLEVLALSDGKYRLEASFEGPEPVRAPPFDAEPLELGAIWQR